MDKNIYFLFIFLKKIYIYNIYLLSIVVFNYFFWITLHFYILTMIDKKKKRISFN